ncbi:sigma-70 family RNA polymerase sigma factor [Actinoplanes sp. NPDC049316]|uniref:sigma-70 family RNA polymerase sigma factor n=1 Tax=Actinoplanes sp. NPDC049316 TaxID=3154727 RepID=UPI00342433A5
MTAAMKASASPLSRVSAALVDELRAILDRDEGRRAQSLVADFVARHGLTHRDVDALLAMLAQRPMSYTTAPPDRSPVRPVVHLDAVAPAAAAASVVPQASPAEVTGGSGRDDDDVRDEEFSDDGLDWMFGADPEPAPASRVSDGVVGKALDDLLGDWTRTGGRLTRAEVALLVTRRGLSATQHGELLTLLEDAGVDLPSFTEAGPVRSTTTRHELHEDTVHHYLRDIGRYPLIDAAREVELWSLMKQGEAAQHTLDTNGNELSRKDRRCLRDRIDEGNAAYTALVSANLRLVVSIAKARHFQQSSVEFADRIQDGNMGLMHAAHLFDGSKGYKFSTYATWWIRQRIERGVADNGRTIRIPVHVHEQIQRVRKAVRKLTARLDREPTLMEIAEATDMEPGKVQAMLDYMRPMLSIDMLLGDEGDLRLSDVLVHEHERDGRTDPAEIVGHAMLHADIERTLRELLPERAACVIERRFGLGTGEEETLDEIGAHYGVTRERIRQIQVKAMKTLREHEGAAALRAYVIDEPMEARTGSSAEGEA